MTVVYDSVERLDVEPVNSKEKRALYAARVKIFPKGVSGVFRKLKWWGDAHHPGDLLCDAVVALVAW